MQTWLFSTYSLKWDINGANCEMYEQIWINYNKGLIWITCWFLNQEENKNLIDDEESKFGIISLQQHFLRKSNYNISLCTTIHLNRKRWDSLKMKTFIVHGNGANFIALHCMYWSFLKAKISCPFPTKMWGKKSHNVTIPTQLHSTNIKLAHSFECYWLTFTV